MCGMSYVPLNAENDVKNPEKIRFLFPTSGHAELRQRRTNVDATLYKRQVPAGPGFFLSMYSKDTLTIVKFDCLRV